MNMPEIRKVIKSVDKGAGIYEGKGDLDSAGMWEVTISARHNGQTIATRKVIVKPSEVGKPEAQGNAGRSDPPGQRSRS
jgi:hypothetical protein